MLKRMWLTMMLLGMAVLFLACSQNNSTEPPERGVDPDPPVSSGKEGDAVTPVLPPKEIDLVFYYYGGGGAEMFMSSFGNHLHEKFPHINVIVNDHTGTNLDTFAEAVAANSYFDIFVAGLDNIPITLMDYGLAYDHAELIKKHQYDITELLPQTIDMLTKVTGGPLYGLPVAGDVLKFLYNRDLFDKFGVPYPEDGMNWDEVFELARLMSRTDDGVSYHGAVLGFEYLARLNQLGVGFVDPSTNQSLFATDNRWQQLISNWVRFYDIPGNEVDSNTVGWGKQHTLFTTDGLAAMDFTLQVLNASWVVNWDIAGFPTLPERPGVGSGVSGGNVFAVTSISNIKDEAFQAVAHFTSKEFQLNMSRRGTMGTHRDREMQAQYGADVPFMEGKNLQALFPDMYADAYPLTPYDRAARTALIAELNKLITGGVPDLNTALRQAAEAADSAIDAQIQAALIK